MTLVPVRIECGAAVYWLAMNADDTSLATARVLIQEEGDHDARGEALLGRLMTPEEATRATVADEDEGPTTIAEWIRERNRADVPPHVIACSEWP